MKFEALIEVYANAIRNGDRTINEVPKILKDKVEEKINNA